MTVSNPSAPTTDLPKPVLDPYGGIPFLPAACTSWVEQIWTVGKLARYRLVLGELAMDPDHLLAIFLVVATGGCLSDPAMKLIKFIVKD